MTPTSGSLVSLPHVEHVEPCACTLSHRWFNLATRVARTTMRVALIAGVMCLAACERPPSADQLKEWSPSDHDRAEEQPRGSGAQQAQQAQQAPQPKGAAGDGGRGNANALVEITWQQSCASCHGPIGRGDGPNGPMVKASDLTRSEWQASVKDEDIAAVIQTGKGRMPKFDLPPAVLKGLVARIRAARQP